MSDHRRLTCCRGSRSRLTPPSSWSTQNPLTGRYCLRDNGSVTVLQIRRPRAWPLIGFRGERPSPLIAAQRLAARECRRVCRVLGSGGGDNVPAEKLQRPDTDFGSLWWPHAMSPHGPHEPSAMAGAPFFGRFQRQSRLGATRRRVRPTRVGVTSTEGVLARSCCGC